MRSISSRIFAALFSVLPLWGLALIDAAPTSAQQLKPVTVRLPFLYNAHRSAYLLGRDKGFYNEEKLDVTVLEGKGTTTSMQLAASKQDTFAVVDPPTLMLGVAQGMPLKTVLMLYQKSPNCIVSWESANIFQPKDLIGKTVVSIQGDTTTTMLFALLAKNQISRGEVNIFTADPGTRTQTFLSKRADANAAFSNDLYLMLKVANPDLRYFMYADYGVNALGDSIVVHADTMKNSPDIVHAFVRATIRAYKYALENPEESVDSLMKAAKTQNRDVEVSKIVATRALVNTPDTAVHGFGYNSKSAWEALEGLMLEFGGLTKKAANIETYYSNEFLPSK